MASDLYNALASDVGGTEDQYLSRDPYYTAGRSVANWNMQPENSSQAVYMPILQGLLSGFLMNYGKSNAKQSAWEDYSSSPMLQSLSKSYDIAPNDSEVNGIGPVANGGTYAEALRHDYTRDTPTEDWSIKTGKQDLLIAALTAQAQEEEKKKKEAILQELATYAEKKKIDAKFKNGEGDGGDGSGGGGGKGLGQAKTDSLLTEKAVADKADSLAKKLEDSKMTYAEFRLARNFSGFDKLKIDQEATDLADKLLRSRSGQAASVQEQEKLKQMILGDWTSTPEDVAKRIRNFAGMTRDGIRAQLEGAEALKTGGTKGLAESLDARVTSEEPRYEIRTLNGKRVKVLIGQ